MNGRDQMHRRYTGPYAAAKRAKANQGLLSSAGTWPMNGRAGGDGSEAYARRAIQSRSSAIKKSVPRRRPTADAAGDQLAPEGNPFTEANDAAEFATEDSQPSGHIVLAHARHEKECEKIKQKQKQKQKTKNKTHTLAVRVSVSVSDSQSQTISIMMARPLHDVRTSQIVVLLARAALLSPLPLSKILGNDK